MVFSKNRTGIWFFLLYYLERWYFSFPKIWSYSLDGKWKVIFLKKVHGNMIFSLNEKMTFPKKKKKKLRWDMIFLVLSGKMVIFFRKIWSFYFRWKKKDKFSQGINGSMIFSVYMYKCYKYDITFLQKKKKKSKMMFTRKNSLKGHWHSRSHSRQSSKNYLCFYRNLYKRFNILLSSEKN